ncbi:hypothetical protein QBC46DRAFT_154386 [Diplogelasinospora grovesii]|uniref:Uncharacterized protein n=1 Tax=Diplogelasinospora grovesii TaxID=303347 RepID=A0AAN6N4N0_9PEZI|nr:hypothetical protein QBC46DRAFT_154386 [Diplogelasinospora grovesii]
MAGNNYDASLSSSTQSADDMDLAYLHSLWDMTVASPPSSAAPGIEGQHGPAPQAGASKWRVNSAKEWVTTVYFLANDFQDPPQGVFVKLPGVLISPYYVHSYMFEGTLRALGHDFTVKQIKPSINPRGGGNLEPIGEFSMYLEFAEDRAALIDFHVLPGSPPDGGFLFIMGEPDITDVFGSDWTPHNHDAKLDAWQPQTVFYDTALAHARLF